MKPKINILELVDGEMKAVTREMNDQEYQNYLEEQKMAEEYQE